MKTMENFFIQVSFTTIIKSGHPCVFLYHLWVGTPTACSRIQFHGFFINSHPYMILYFGTCRKKRGSIWHNNSKLKFHSIDFQLKNFFWLSSSAEVWKFMVIFWYVNGAWNKFSFSRHKFPIEVIRSKVKLYRQCRSFN